MTKQRYLVEIVGRICVLSGDGRIFEKISRKNAENLRILMYFSDFSRESCSRNKKKSSKISISFRFSVEFSINEAKTGRIRGFSRVSGKKLVILIISPKRHLFLREGFVVIA